MTLPTGQVGLLEPGVRHGHALAGDAAVLDALVRAELAWARTLAEAGRAPAELPSAIAGALRSDPLDVLSVAERAADGGNPSSPSWTTCACASARTSGASSTGG